MSVYIPGYTKADIEEIVMWAKVGKNNCMIGDSMKIVELPPHGDLIDRDAILQAERTKPIAKMMMFGGSYVFDESAIYDAPVIIPADKEDTE